MYSKDFFKEEKYSITSMIQKTINIKWLVKHAIVYTEHFSENVRRFVNEYNFLLARYKIFNFNIVQEENLCPIKFFEEIITLRYDRTKYNIQHLYFYLYQIPLKIFFRCILFKNKLYAMVCF